MKSIPRKDLQTHTLLSKYARFLPEQRRRETHREANKRTIDMHRRRFGPEHDDTMSWLLDELDAEHILGSQRSLQFAGPAIERISARLFNCSASFFDRPRFLAEAVWLLLCGCGVGFSVQKHHVAKLPKLRGPRGRRKHFVDDSIEGWADSFDALFQSYIHGAAKIDFVYDRVRPEGSPLSTSSAKAPGPKPLADALENVRRVFDRVVFEQDGVIRPIDAYDIVMHAAMCVRAGGIRRSATICIFSPDDVEMRDAKTGNWFAENPQRRLSNNSAMLVRATTTREEFAALMSSTKQFGEPGFYFSDSTEIVPNPCIHPDEMILTPDGYKRIGDLVGQEIEVLTDNRIVDINTNNLMNEGVTTRKTSAVKLTQRNAKVYKVTTVLGKTIRATANHTFPVVGQARKRLDELQLGDTLLLRDPYSEHSPEAYERVASIEFDCISDVYCLNEPVTNSIVVNGIVTGQCVEIALDPVDHKTGETTFAFCNVTSVNCAGVEDELDFQSRVEAATVLGTYQAAYTDFAYLGPAAERVAKRDALLGVSLTGMADAPSWIFDPDVLREAANRAVITNLQTAWVLGINPAARVTTVKPEGTGSLMLGVGNGIHPHHSRRYLRHVEGGKWNDPIVKFMLQHVPMAVVQSAYNPNEVKLVFPIDLGDGELWLKGDTEALDHLAKVATVQKEWVQTGRTRDDAHHNVSNTVVVKPHEWDDVEDYIWNNRDVFAGVSLLGSFGDLDYPQAPFVEVLPKAEAEAKYGPDPERLAKATEVRRQFEDLVAAWPKDGIPWGEFVEDEDASAGTEILACAAGGCAI